MKSYSVWLKGALDRSGDFGRVTPAKKFAAQLSKAAKHVVNIYEDAAHGTKLIATCRRGRCTRRP